MSIHGQFKDLLQTLDQASLDELRQSVRVEMGARRQETTIRMEHIHPGMSDDQKEAAMKEIARVLRGDD